MAKNIHTLTLSPMHSSRVIPNPTSTHPHSSQSHVCGHTRPATYTHTHTAKDQFHINSQIESYQLILTQTSSPVSLPSHRLPSTQLYPLPLSQLSPIHLTSISLSQPQPTSIPKVTQQLLSLPQPLLLTRQEREGHSNIVSTFLEGFLECYLLSTKGTDLLPVLIERQFRF